MGNGRVSGLRVATVKAAANGKWEIIISFDTQEQAARFQSLAYQIGMFADCATPTAAAGKTNATVVVQKPTTDDQFFNGLAKTQTEAGFRGGNGRNGGNGKPPSEKQINLAKLIARKLIVALPTEKSSRAYYDFIKRYKDEFDSQVKAEKAGKRM